VRLKTGLSAAVTFVVFAVFVAAFVGYVASLGIRVSPPAARTRLSMNVADINNMAVGSNVLLRGVPVGKVTGIDTSVSNATIHFYVNGQYQVPVDSDVRLENLSALGESYIELEPRSVGGPTFRDGQRISADSVKQPASISELGASVVRVLNQLDPGQLSRVVGEADVGLPDPNSVLPNLARASLLLRNTTADFKGQGRELLDNFQVLLQNASFVGPALAGGAPPIRDLGTEVHVIWQQTSSVGLPMSSPMYLFKTSTLIHRIQKFLDDRGVDLRVLGEATSANVKLIANALKNLDSSQILANLLTTVPADGVIELHVPIPPQG
jgi:phospholipid/cholesterol/gamma-HCH transport system substrate-binding protein